MNAHSKTVIDLINKEQVRIAREQLKMIDDDFGTDHSEILGEIRSVIASLKCSEIGLYEMISDYARQ
jgi:hypothetical protein